MSGHGANESKISEALRIRASYEVDLHGLGLESQALHISRSKSQIGSSAKTNATIKLFVTLG